MIRQVAAGGVLFLASGAAQAIDWTDMGGTTNMHIFIGVDNAARSGDLLMAYFRGYFSSEPINPDVPPSEGSDDQIQVNCADGHMQIVRRTFYLNGQVTESGPATKSDADFVLRSVGHHVKRLACPK